MSPRILGLAIVSFGSLALFYGVGTALMEDPWSLSITMFGIFFVISGILMIIHKKNNR